MSRTAWLVIVAMLMFSAGAAVQTLADDTADRILGAVAILGAIAVVVANVNGKGEK